MAKFKVGDRVSHTRYGAGTIRSLAQDRYVGVEFDSQIGGHDLTSAKLLVSIKYGHGWWCHPETLTLCEQPRSIIIYSDGTITTALLKEGKKTIKTAIAKCSPADTYDFETGARIAFDRLCTEVSKFPPKEDKPVREVKRPAKAGEYIKITNAWTTAGNYKDGDILRVIKPSACGVKVHFPRGKGVDDDGCYYITNFEYVVLENYSPKG